MNRTEDGSAFNRSKTGYSVHKGGTDMAENNENKEFFSYKGLPLVRKNDTIYYGNMYDDYVVMMEIKEKTNIGGLDVASKIRIYKMATDEKLNPMEAIVKSSEKTSLYEALDIAYVWLSRTSSEQ